MMGSSFALPFLEGSSGASGLARPTAGRVASAVGSEPSHASASSFSRPPWCDSKVGALVLATAAAQWTAQRRRAQKARFSAPPLRSRVVRQAEAALVGQPGQQIVFFGGKGGVGKTSSSSSFAAASAAEGKKVLIISTDPAHSLGDALAEQLNGRPRQVADNLFAMEVDPEEALEELRESLKVGKEHRTGLRGFLRSPLLLVQRESHKKIHFDLPHFFTQMLDAKALPQP
ncbi:unnamed protein product [Durusdinium trenchii]|uniref:Uncharacterized protein n=2 Tax=Durusdinium trenchii TaxID=1381693 RepID=A0ABP0PCQ3_9DINO